MVASGVGYWVEGKQIQPGCIHSLDWKIGLDYWTDIFLVFTHAVVGLIDFHWLGVLRKYLAYP